MPVPAKQPPPRHAPADRGDRQSVWLDESSYTSRLAAVGDLPGNLNPLLACRKRRSPTRDSRDDRTHAARIGPTPNIERIAHVGIELGMNVFRHACTRLPICRLDAPV